MFLQPKPAHTWQQLDQFEDAWQQQIHQLKQRLQTQTYFEVQFLETQDATLDLQANALFVFPPNLQRQVTQWWHQPKLEPLPAWFQKQLLPGICYGTSLDTYLCQPCNSQTWLTLRHQLYTEVHRQLDYVDQQSINNHLIRKEIHYGI